MHPPPTPTRDGTASDIRHQLGSIQIPERERKRKASEATAAHAALCKLLVLGVCVETRCGPDVVRSHAIQMRC
jgi:hypothetical protein